MRRIALVSFPKASGSTLIPLGQLCVFAPSLGQVNPVNGRLFSLTQLVPAKVLAIYTESKGDLLYDLAVKCKEEPTGYLGESPILGVPSSQVFPSE